MAAHDKIFPRFEFGAAVSQVFNLPGGRSFLFRLIASGAVVLLLAMMVIGIPIFKP